MKKVFLLILLTAAAASPASAGSINVLAGYAMPSGDSDVFQQNERELTFEPDDLNDFSISVGYDFFLGDYVNLGGSFSWYEGDTDAIDRDFVFEDGSPIFRNVRLQIVPLEANVKFLPVGRDAVLIPYVGGGVGVYFWEYEEFGDFVVNRDPTNPDFISGTAFSDGADPGFHVEGGVYIPIGHSVAVAAEAKYWDAEGDLDPEGFDPLFEPIDLSGFQIAGGISFWF
ncbi:MAG TPA: outer membrane beta-barrel protein [Acidobacteriota bacterium]|nr:outer membrane beta-barrel protein [Acidobacteriota bacterium]